MAALSAAAAGRSQMTAAEVSALQNKAGGLSGQLSSLQMELEVGGPQGNGCRAGGGMDRAAECWHAWTHGAHAGLHSGCRVVAEGVRGGQSGW